MNRTFLERALLLAAVVIVTLVASSCEGGGVGVGVSAGAPTRWGRGASGAPPVFVGGPSF